MAFLPAPAPQEAWSRYQFFAVCVTIRVNGCEQQAPEKSSSFRFFRFDPFWNASGRLSIPCRCTPEFCPRILSQLLPQLLL